MTKEAGSLEFVPHRLNAGNFIHQVPVRRFETLHERALVATDQNREDVALMPRRPDGRMITAVDEVGVAVARHDHFWFGPAAVGPIAKLRAESVLRPVAVMINFLEGGFFRRIFRVVLVRTDKGTCLLRSK